MQFLYKFLANFFKSEEERKKLVTIIVPSFAMQTVAVLLGLATNFILARGLGAGQYGVFTYAFSIVFPVVSLVSFSLSVLMMREIPALLVKGEHGLLRGLHKWSLKIAIPVCLILTLLVFAVVYFLPFTTRESYRIPILIATFVIPFYGLMNYYSASLRGMHKIVVSQVADNLLRPGGFVLLIAILYFYSGSVGVYPAIYINIVAFAIGFAFSAFQFYKSFKFKDIEPLYDNKKWLTGLTTLAIFNSLLSLDSRLDIILLGAIKDSVQVGIFNIAHKIAMALFFFLSVMNTVIAPSMSRLHATNDKARMQEILTRTVRWVMVFSTPAAIIIICFSKWIMLYFGADFEQGRTALIMLCVTQLFSISCGPVGVVSIMTGHEKYNSVATVLSIATTITFNLILTPTMGLTGCAIAACAAIIVWNIYMIIIVKRKVGVYTWIYTLK